MQLYKNTFFTFLFALMATVIWAQDFHYTQYFFSPLSMNPATAGAYNGSYRINGIFRDQYRGSANNAFTGYSLNVDAPIIRGFRKQDWVGVGLRLESDKAGSVGQQMNMYGLGISYHLSLDKKQTSIFTIGAQYGSGGISYSGNSSDYVTATSILSGGQSANLNPNSGGLLSGANPGENAEGGSLGDLTVGLLYTKRNPKAGSTFQIGAGVEGILNPNRGALRIDEQGIGLNVHSSFENTINRRTSLTTGGYFYSKGPGNAWILNSILNYKMKPGNEMILHGGLGTRAVRSALLYLGATIKGIRVGLAYDLDIASSTEATGGHKGIELGVSYTGIIFKKPKPKPIIYCPRL